MLNSSRRTGFTLCLALLAAGLTLAGHDASAAKRKAGAKMTPSQKAGIPPEAFGSPVQSPDKTRLAWIADEGDGPNLFVGAAPGRANKVEVTKYKFGPKQDVMPGLPILWSPDGKFIAFYEYSHHPVQPTSSAHAVIVRADGTDDPMRLSIPGSDLNTRPVRWMSDSTLRFRGLHEASVTAVEDWFVYDLSAKLAQTEANYLAAQAALKAAADSAARAAAAAAVPAAPSGGKKK